MQSVLATSIQDVFSKALYIVYIYIYHSFARFSAYNDIAVIMISINSLYASFSRHELGYFELALI